ncbi:serine hydrolase FSH [Echria macrotheca]|uniref:Serine hydrolase FSH n=1 Tax=Echria macrotheca TaxID=438768 RepID=A0AAJ0F2E8_9PEZI|nr:serine hydrolase FSH [Echria macrotheca]
MDADEGTGAWVGLMGFSQGAKLAASILWRQENVSGPLPRLSPEVQFRFAVLMAGGAPPVMLDPTGALPVPPGIETADNLSLAFDDWPATNEGEHVIGIPTLHVHGLKDPGIERHRKLLDLYCERGTARVVEWDGDHRIPFKTADVSMVVKEILQMAKEAGVL